MSDAGEGTTQTDTATDQNNDNGPKFTQADLDRIVSERVARERKKFEGYDELKKFRENALTEHEKALEAAKKAGASEAAAKASERLVKAEFKAIAAGRIENIDDLLEDLNLAKFVNDDGEPNEKAIQARIEKLVPAKAKTNFDGGARGSGAGAPVDMNTLIRRQAGLA